MKNHFSLIIMLVFLLSCGITESDEKTIVIKTDKNSYKADSLTTIILTVENELASTLYYVCSGDIFLEELQNNTIINSWKVHGFEECLAAVSINTNENTTFDVSPFYEPSFIVNATFDKSVAYRLKIDLYEDNKFMKVVDKALLYSNNFKITK